MKKLCVHAHFYQPTREDLLRGGWRREESAAPYVNWNARITAECYGPNIAARLLDNQGNYRDERNNYAYVSFDCGPTLLRYLESEEPAVYQGVLDGDKAAQARFNGHGTALAQSYHHSILPLCNERDKRTELAWGLADFERRFGRKAEGIWLPEAAVDTPTLEAIAETEVKFVLLAPQQVARIQDPEGNWYEANGRGDLSSRPYQVSLPSGNSIAVFVYDGGLSHGVAFSGYLHNGDYLAQKVGERAAETEFVSIATDGESYGHHHRYGEMALARAIEIWEGRGDLEMTVFGEVLAAQEPTWTLEIVENSAWSCSHGIGRWANNCGCRGGRGDETWTQEWREPLRQALEFLRDELAKLYERDAGKLLRDVWAARDDFGQVVSTLDPGARDSALTKWWEKHGASSDKRAFAKVCELLEVQRHGLAMFTSCAWFFDDLAGIETIQVLRHADRAIELAEKVHRARLRSKVARRLSDALSNEATPRSGAEILEDIAAERLAHVPASPIDRETLKERQAGVVLHPTSLPGAGPVGSLGRSAREFVDWMVRAGLRVWQILPLNPTDRGGSPYSSFSALSGNPLLVDLEELAREALLTDEELQAGLLRTTPDVSFQRAFDIKLPILRLAAKRLLNDPVHPWRHELDEFRAQAWWVDEVATFVAIKDTLEGASWWDWPAELRDREAERLQRVKDELDDARQEWIAIEFFFDRQWRALRRYCAARGVSILGDIPIYVAGDSVDVWAHQSYFELGDDSKPTFISGAPPDVYSAIGQSWGNPLYRWDELERHGYDWWIARLRRALEHADLVRLDHFRGFAAYWAIPADAEDARSGSWRPGPGPGLFDKLLEALGSLPLIAEDLGTIDEPVRDLQRRFALPGMLVQQFAYDGQTDNDHLSYRATPNTVMYSGTHDSDTTAGWWSTSPEYVRDHARRYLSTDGSDIVWDVIRSVLQSPARLALIPFQDFLCLGSDARMNTPGTLVGNWSWRMSDSIGLRGDVRDRIRTMINLYGRSGRESIENF